MFTAVKANKRKKTNRGSGRPTKFSALDVLALAAAAAEAPASTDVAVASPAITHQHNGVPAASSHKKLTWNDIPKAVLIAGILCYFTPRDLLRFILVNRAASKQFAAFFRQQPYIFYPDMGPQTVMLTCAGFWYGWGDKRRLLPPDPRNLVFPTPLALTLIEDASFRAITQGSSTHGAILTRSGNVYGWAEDNQNGELGLPYLDRRYGQPTMIAPAHFEHSPVKQLYCGGTHTIVRTEAGKYFTWGRPKTAGYLELPKTRKPIALPMDAFGGAHIANLSVHRNATFAFTTDYHFFTWGENTLINPPAREERLSFLPHPTRVTRESLGSPLKAWYFLRYVTVLLTADNTLHIWPNTQGQMAFTQITGATLALNGSISSISQTAHTDDLWIQTDTNQVYTLTISNKSDMEKPGIQPIPATYTLRHMQSLFEDKKIAQLFYRSISHFALTATGEMFAWGDNSSGLLGLGDQEPRTEPTRINQQYFANRPVAKFFGPSDGRMFAVTTPEKTSDDRDTCFLFAWGYNEYGALGVGSFDQKKYSVPTQVHFDGPTPLIKNVILKDDTVYIETAGKAEAALFGVGSNQQGLLCRPPSVLPASNTPRSIFAKGMFTERPYPLQDNPPSGAASAASAAASAGRKG